MDKEERSAANAVKESEAFLRSIIDYLPDMVFVKDSKELRFVHMNRAAEELLGYSRDELIGKNDYDFFPPDQADFFTRKDRSVLDGGTLVDIPAEPIDTKSGRRILHTKKIPLCDAFGRPRYLLGMSEDITERHDADAASAVERQARQARVEQVLGAGAITMAFQPIVALATGDVVGVEALARFPNSTRPPNVWFDEAHEVGLGDDLELVAIAAALERLNDIPPSAYLSLNVAPSTATTRAFRKLIDRAPGTRIVLELTEHASVGDYGKLADALDPLRVRGVRVAVDDAGAGFASFRHILNLNPDIIKLDMALTRGIQTDPIRRALASALVSFAHELNAVIVAEGIETEPELKVLRSLGVGYGQGFFLARPASLPLGRITAFSPTDSPRNHSR